MSGQNKGARKRLLFMLSLTTSFFFVELIVGYVTNSMALVADSFHMLSDVIALVIAYVSVLMSPKKWAKNTFGWARAEVLGALVNAVFLCALCFSILIESIKRFYNPEEIHEPVLILCVGFAGLVVNVIGLFLFHGSGGSHGHAHGGGGGGHGHSHGGGKSHSHEPAKNKVDTVGSESSSQVSSLSPDLEVKGKQSNKPAPKSSQQMNMRGVFLHVLADALGSVIVCISALIIMFTDWSLKEYVDPSLSVLMVCLIMYSTWPLLVESAMILLQTVPTHIEVDGLRKKLTREIDGVIAVHEFHVWQLAGDRIIASAHIRCHNLADYMRIAEKVKEFFHNEGIHSTTIQPEFVDNINLEDTGDSGSTDVKLQGNLANSKKEMWYQTKEDQENCVLDCPQNTTCAAQTCCGPKKETSKLNLQNGMYKGYYDSTPTAIRRRPRNGEGPEIDLLEVPLSEVNVEPVDNSDGEDEVGPEVKLSGLRGKYDNSAV